MGPFCRRLSKPGNRPVAETINKYVPGNLQKPIGLCKTGAIQI